MPFKKVRFGEGEICKIEIIDCYGKVVEKWKVMLKDFPKLVRILNDKWNLRMIVKEKTKSDLDWANKF